VLVMFDVCVGTSMVNWLYYHSKFQFSNKFHIMVTLIVIFSLIVYEKSYFEDIIDVVLHFQ
jgi:hypothetical protein